MGRIAFISQSKNLSLSIGCNLIIKLIKWFYQSIQSKKWNLIRVDKLIILLKWMLKTFVFRCMYSERERETQIKKE